MIYQPETIAWCTWCDIHPLGINVWGESPEYVLAFVNFCGNGHVYSD